ncbi:extracellular solute-binding protein [Bacillus gobiensis]|uniref:extracellular solute-binding protein n=1 Tax=Bacillus gobiensis TaxID=1441095 RepID=UPI003D1C2731
MLFILLLLAGCGDPSVISDPKDVQNLERNEKKEIIFWHSYGEEETRILEQELIPAFEKEHPHIRVTPLHLANKNELRYTLIARTTSIRGPDVVRLDNSLVPEFSQKGLLQPLSQYPEFENIRRDLPSEEMDLGFHNNHYYSIPLNLYTKVAIYNRDLLNQAGYTAPPRTMEEVFKVAREQRSAVGLGGIEAWHTLPYIYSLGGTFTNKNFSKSTGYLNGKETVRAVEQLLLLYKEKLLVFSLETGGFDNWEGVKDGNILMTDEGPWFYNLLNQTELKRSRNQTNSAQFPQVKRTASIKGGENLVILKGSQKPDEAWTFIKWMSGKEPQLIMSRTGLIPANKKAFHALEVDRNSYVYPYLESLDSAFSRPPVKNWSRIDELYTEYMRKIFQGEMSVKDGLDRVASEIDKLLDDNGEKNE